MNRIHHSTFQFQINCLNPQPFSPLSTFLKPAMYPKVKVREFEDDDGFSLPAFESLSLHASSPEKKMDSTPITVRVPEFYISKSDKPTIPPPKEAEKKIKKNDADENKVNDKPNSFLRPRAVLSSPVNDGMIGIKNKTKTEVHSGLKSHNSCQNRHLQCKVNPRPIVFGTPVSPRSEEASHVKHSCPGTKRSVIDEKRRKKHSLQHTHTPAIDH